MGQITCTVDSDPLVKYRLPKNEDENCEAVERDFLSRDGVLLGSGDMGAAEARYTPAPVGSETGLADKKAPVITYPFAKGDMNSLHRSWELGAESLKPLEVN
jgi:hypothetical protein